MDGSLGELQNSNNKAVYQSNKSEVYKKIKNICQIVGRKEKIKKR